ncbi:hypothetical protein CGRA01v4_14025 [Colletotrichum graminicola]|nr:hypothetical protein CGRA01v4_14025 [Colletotrichum graminicola]
MTGPISSLSILGDTIIIINDAQIAFDLFEKQSLKFSDRPLLEFTTVVGYVQSTGALQYNETLRAHRKQFSRARAHSR